MPTSTATRVVASIALTLTACAAEHLDARDPGGPARAELATVPVTRPTDLVAT